jgi:predicted enzyme involved in methoxymalonyl-ACP biosynthesis
VVGELAYTPRLASLLGEKLAGAIAAPTRSNAIITDLDNAIWSRIVGEVGVPEIRWDLDHHGDVARNSSAVSPKSD